MLLILKSFRKNDFRIYHHLDQQKLGSLLPVRGIVTDLLMNRIADLLGVKLAPSLPLYTPQSSHLEHFKRIIDRNVTLSYLDFLEQLEEKVSFSVWEAWLNMFRDRCNITWTMPTLRPGDEHPELPNLNPPYDPDQQQHTILSCHMTYCDAENFIIPKALPSSADAHSPITKESHQK